MYPQYVEDENKDKGIIRLVQRGTLTQISGGGGAEYGIFTVLGDIPLDEVSLNHPQIEYLRNHKPSESRIAYHDYSYDGVSSDGYSYKNAICALNGMTYVVRFVNYSYYDTLVAFQVIRRDALDGA